jgi:hypothetical protein
MARSDRRCAHQSEGSVRRSDQTRLLHGDEPLPARQFSKPHFHPNDRFITVVQGTWYVGTGNKWDKDATIGVKAGGAVTHFAKQVHYDGAKDEEVVVIITGEGPATNIPVEMSQ